MSRVRGLDAMSNETAKFFEITIRPDETLPALSTDVPEKPFSFLAFLEEFGLSSESMLQDENLPHRFEIEDAIAATKPIVGGSIRVSEAAWLAVKTGAKAQIDACMNARPMQIAPPYVSKVLRHYYGLVSAKRVSE